MLVAGLCFFGGVGLGMYLESGEEKHEDSATHSEASHAGAGHAEHAHEHASGIAHSDHHTAATPAVTAPANDVLVDPDEVNTPDADVNQRSMAGLFFSIYYCMTGIHAIHIIGGMIVITWLIIKAARFEFHEEYFGPVDNVGLYWHLVDFIWIYLFPLLYLIT